MVIFAALLNLGSGRVITSEQESILRSIDELKELTLNLEKKNEESAAQIEGSGAETGSASRVIPQNSNHDASGESVDEAFEADVNVTAPPEATARRVRRNLPAEPSCLHSFFVVTLSANKTFLHPVCRATANDPAACFSSIARHGSRKCELSNYVLIQPENVFLPTDCSCAL